MKNRKSIDIVTHKNHTEVGAAGSGSDGGSPSNGTTNSSFSFEGGEQKISRPGCFSGANDQSLAAIYGPYTGLL
ncbi:hypothetical protein SAY86_007979 [Trapa natans]|uniref:Uncharacterized protein n=1 Tax=Trapa natans TaxID=22666 RepID=A0AAN7R0P3_TRANT|nr:hypothetical protein SAY86_007979 [Trapa natans]